MEENKRQVLLGNPGSKLSFQIALSLQEADLLESFVTGFYYRKDSLLFRSLRVLPPALRKKLEKEFRRRYIEGLDVGRVITSDIAEFIMVGSRRLGLSKSLFQPIGEWRCKRISKKICDRILKHKPRAVICCDGWGREIFSACEKAGSLKILDQNTGHVTKAAEILREEALLHPEFADTIPEFPDGLLERCTEESLQADAIIVSSQYASNSLQAIGVAAERIHQVPYGANVSRFSPSEARHEKFRFLFVGNVSQRKGIKYLLEAFRSLALPNAELVLVGTRFGSKAALEPYRDIFTHIDNVPYDDMPEIYRSADVFVHPALHESGVLSIHEALATGLPVITTAHAGSIVRDQKEGFIVPIRDVEALANKMESLYRDKQLREELSMNARQRGKEYTWERYRRNLSDVIRRLVKES